jgi:O-antigen/teichoic acid export membrane protein
LSSRSLLNSSLFLFMDQVIVAATNWLFWIVISKITDPFNIGQATVIYSLVLVASTISQLGLEYTLLRKSLSTPEVIATTLALEIVLTSFTLPFVLYFVGYYYNDSLQFVWILTVVLLFSSSLGFMSRFVLLGLSNSRDVLLVDIVGVLGKFVVGYMLVLSGYGGLGLITSFVVQTVLVCGITMWLAKFSLKFTIQVETIKEILWQGIVNTPAKLSRMFIVNLSVVLLASLGITSSEIGIFYIILMITIVAGSLSSSIAYMLIPASQKSKIDLSSLGTRLGLSLTAPLVTILLVIPEQILGFIGPQYESSADVLTLLAIGIIPSAVTMISISKFNNMERYNRIVIIGIIQVMLFVIPFYILVPKLGILGGSWSMLLAYIGSAVAATVWMDKKSIKFIINSAIAIFLGVFASYVYSVVINNSDVFRLTLALIVTVLSIFFLKNTSTDEVINLVRSFAKKGK